MRFTISRMTEQPIVIVTLGKQFSADTDSERLLEEHISAIMMDVSGPVYRIDDLSQADQAFRQQALQQQSEANAIWVRLQQDGTTNTLSHPVNSVADRKAPPFENVDDALLYIYAQMAGD